MIQRQITIAVTPEHIEDIPIEEVSNAIGYLCTWAWHGNRYGEVTISSRPEELFVYYKGEDKFVMGAVWRGTKFSYHS